MKKTGYIICQATGSSSVIPGVDHVEVDDTACLFDDDYEAAKQAEKDGIRIIHDLPGIEDWTYVDTAENREKISAWVREHPEYLREESSVCTLRCEECDEEFSTEEAIHEAELAWHRGEPKGDYVCPYCGADDSRIQPI